MKNVLKKLILIISSFIVATAVSSNDKALATYTNNKAANEFITQRNTVQESGSAADNERSTKIVPNCCSDDFILKDFDPVLKKALLFKLGKPYTEENFQSIQLNYYDLSRVNYLVVPESFGQITKLDGIENCINLTSLNLSGQKSIEDYSKIGNLTNLVSLNLSETNLSSANNNLNFISNLKELRVLDLHSDNIENLAFLENLQNLVSLDVSGKAGTHGDISDLIYLQKLKNLHLLYLSNNSINNIDVLHNLTKLTALHLANNNIDSTKAISNLYSLIDLDLSNNNIDSIEDLYPLTNLEHLCLEHNKISDISDIPVLRKLETLTLTGNRIFDISPLIQLLKLNYVTLSDQEITLDTIENPSNPFTFEHKLVIDDEKDLANNASQFIFKHNNKEVTPDNEKITCNDNINESKFLSYTFESKSNQHFQNATANFNGIIYVPVKINGKDCDPNTKETLNPSQFQSSTENSAVRIGDNVLKLGILKALGKVDNSKKLKDFYEGQTKKDDNSTNLPTLKSYTITPYEMATLNYLTIQGTDDEKIKSLSGLQYCINLTVLDLYGNNITNVRYLAGLRNLTNLNLGGNPNLTNIKSLSNLTNLTTFSVFNDKVEDITPIKNLTSLTSLYLHGNNISFTGSIDTEANVNDNAFKNLKNLKILFLSHNNLKNFNLKNISDYLPKLTTLELRECQLSSINDLSPLENLISLDVANVDNNQSKWNSISDLSAVSNMTNLRFLYLIRNNISNLSPLNNLENLEFLPMSGNKISDLSQLNNLKSLNNIKYLDLTAQQINLENIDFNKNIIINCPVKPFCQTDANGKKTYSYVYLNNSTPNTTITSEGDIQKISWSNLNTCSKVNASVSSRLYINEHFAKVPALYSANITQPINPEN